MPVAWCVCVWKGQMKGGCPQPLCSLEQDCEMPCGSSQRGLASHWAGLEQSRQHASIWHRMEPVGMFWQRGGCRGNKLRQIIRKTWTAWNGLDVHGSDPSPILPSTRSLDQLPHWDPMESCVFAQSAFFCVLGQWKWITALAGISPKVGTQPFWSTDGVRSGFSLQTGEAMWFSYNLERFLTEWRLIRCLEFPRNNVDSVSSLHTTRTHS